MGWVLTFARRRVRFVGRISVYGCNNRVGNAGRHNITLNDVNTEAASLHRFLRERCGLPQERCPLASRVVGTVELDDIRIEKVIYDAEPSSSVPAHLYVPNELRAPAPALVMSSGHGGSKGVFYNQYAGQLYAKAGVVVLVPDPIGEEERHLEGLMGTRAHDQISDEAHRLGRPVLGKMVWDLIRGIDYLEERPDLVDRNRIGTTGHSLGAMVSAYLAALDDRIRLAMLASMYFHPPESKGFCVIGMYRHIEERVNYPRLLAMAAPRCAVLMLVGDDDPICGGNQFYRNGFLKTFEEARGLFARIGASDDLGKRVYENAGHRPYFLNREALLWIEKHFGLPNWDKDEVLALPSIRLGSWVQDNGALFEPRYGTDQNYAGTAVLDVGARYLPPAQLACLPPTEAESPSFTIDAWLAHIAEAHRDDGRAHEK